MKARLLSETPLAGPAVVRRLVLTRAPRIIRARTRDNMMTFDRRTVDSTGAFLIGELERLDQELHMPLVSTTWTRDIDLREDVTIADESSSFTNSSFAAAGGLNPSGKAWISKDANAITGIALDIGKTATPLTLWGMEVKYTIPELESAQKLGRPVDTQKYDGMKLKHDMDVDEQVYIGDTTLGFTGMCNATGVTHGNVAAGAAGPTTWASKTPDEILDDVNTLLNATWAASAWARIPDQLRLPPVQYSMLVSKKVSLAGNMSILEYLKQNNLAKQNGQQLNIQPLKWLIGMGAGGTPQVLGTVDRMMAYSRDRSLIRYPMTLLNRTPLEYRSLFHITTYFCRLGVVEIPYTETVQYADGL